MNDNDQTLPLDHATPATNETILVPPPAEETATSSAVPWVVPGAVPAASDPTPRTRWAGIVWGLALAATAGAGIWLASGTGRVDDLVAWIRDLSPATAVGYGVLVVGALVLVTGLVGLLRRAQRTVAAQRSATDRAA